MTRAFVLGAGLGTRLKTLTERLPKPLIPVAGKPLITYAFDQLIAGGISGIVINTHHCPAAYDEAFPTREYEGAHLTFEHEPVLLETAGGIKNAERHFRGEPFVVFNGDILTDIPIAPVIEAHKEAGNEVTMVLRSHGEPLHVALEAGRVIDIAGRLGKPGPRHLFTGIYVVEPEFLRRIPERAKISVIPIFMEMIARGASLGGVIMDEGQWWDLGTRESYLDVHAAIDPAGRWIDPAAQIAPGAHAGGFLAAAQGAIIEAGAQVTDCILWPGARVLPNSRLTRCIVTAGRTAEGEHTGADF